MAQVSVTHLRATTPEFRREFHDLTRISVGIHLFGLEPEAITPEDLTVRTLLIDTDASSSGADAEIHVEIAQGDQPKGDEGQLLDPESSEDRLNSIARRIGQQVCAEFGVTVNVWGTCYAKSGWSNYQQNEPNVEVLS